MINEPSHDAKSSLRFAEPPWNETTAWWRHLDAQLPPDHLARELRDAMTHLDLTPLYHTYAGVGKAAYCEVRRSKSCLQMSKNIGGCIGFPVVV